MADPKRFLLRLDPRLFEAIRGWAEDDLRSINAQIEYLLADQARRAGRLAYKGKPRPIDTSPPPDIDDNEDLETPAASAPLPSTGTYANPD
jgi:hypothetical protein